MKWYKISIVVIFCILAFITYGEENEEFNSILGIKIGMSKDETLLRLNQLKLDYESYPENNEINFEYDILRDTKEQNFIRLFYKDDLLVQIWVYFYKYSVFQQTQTSRRFQDYLNEIDKKYDNDINWKGKWRSKDGLLTVETKMDIRLDIVYDILVIKRNFKS